jgi:hypothetical protein
MRRWIGVLMLVLSTGSSVDAEPINPSFESGFSGWDVVRPTQTAVVAVGGDGQLVFGGPAPMGFVSATNLFSFDMLGNPYDEDAHALDGSTFALINSKNGVFRFDTPLSDIYVGQSLFLEAGALLSGWARFGNGDYLAQDDAWVRIRDDRGGLLATPWVEHSGSAPNPYPSNATYQNSVPMYALTPWVQWSWQSPTSGFYQVHLGVSTRGDADLASYGMFDAVHVPEPGTSFLTMLGVGAVLFSRRWRT